MVRRCEMCRFASNLSRIAFRTALGVILIAYSDTISGACDTNQQLFIGMRAPLEGKLHTYASTP